jgi:hypothetical protein
LRSDSAAQEGIDQGAVVGKADQRLKASCGLVHFADCDGAIVAHDWRRNQRQHAIVVDANAQLVGRRIVGGGSTTGEPACSLPCWAPMARSSEHPRPLAAVWNDTAAIGRTARVRYERCMLARSFGVALAFLLIACSTLPTTSVPGNGSELHVVLFWLKPDMPAAERAALSTELATKANRIDGLQACWCGGPVESTRDVVDDSFDWMLVMRFRDHQAAQDWQSDPIHQQLLTRFAPHFAKVVVYDGK